MNRFGRLFCITTFGESHGPAVGAVVDGCPAGVPLETQAIQMALDRRRPGQSVLTTARAEADRCEVLSGVFAGKTLGTPIAMFVRNTDARPQDYDTIRQQPRTGHADAVWLERFKHRDHRGGGRTSARETVGRVMGGAVAEALLRRDIDGFACTAWVSTVGNIAAPAPPDVISRAQVDQHATRCWHPETATQMAEEIARAKQAGDSLGGVVDLAITGLPVGLGEPVFGKLKAQLAHGLAGIPSVTGVTWGPADIVQRLTWPGSVFHTRQDAYGGVQGGMATGQPVHARVYFKPPATLGANARQGRHDPCVLPRAVPIVEAMALLTVADLWLLLRASPHLP